MNTMDAILTRRSVRRYDERDVEHGKIEHILRAAMYAPSAHDSRDWDFIVVRDTDSLDFMAGLLPYYRPISRAPVSIIVCGRPDLQNSEVKDYFIQDCSAATQNILLAAHEIGLGALWCGLWPRKSIIERVANKFEIPSNVIPFSIVAIGYPLKNRVVDERYDISKIHNGKW